jgi:protein-tyrosine phosphatase
MVPPVQRNEVSRPGPARSRGLEVDGLVNARDLGGLRRRNGTRTPRGVFYRSENVDWVTPAGWDQIHTEGIATIVDLRQPGERARDTSRRPGWLTTIEVDLDGLENQDFWRDYWDNGLVGTALYFLPHLEAMPGRAGAALSAIVSAPPGGVLFHCMGGRDRTGMIAMLLLTAAGTEPGEIVDDYMETVRLGDLRAATANRNNAEPEIDAFCRALGTTTEGAFRAAVAGLDLARLLTAAQLSPPDRRALATWRGTLPGGPPSLAQ